MKEFRLRAKPGEPKLVPLSTNVSEPAYEALCRMASEHRMPLAVFVREVAIRQVLKDKR